MYRFAVLIFCINETSYSNGFQQKNEVTKKQILDGIRKAVGEVKQIKTGKKRAVLLKDFLNEL